MTAAVALDVTSLYAGAIGLLATFLSARTVRARRATVFTKTGSDDLLEAYVKVCFPVRYLCTRKTREQSQ